MLNVLSGVLPCDDICRFSIQLASFAIYICCGHRGDMAIFKFLIILKYDRPLSWIWKTIQALVGFIVGLLRAILPNLVAIYCSYLKWLQRSVALTVFCFIIFTQRSSAILNFKRFEFDVSLGFRVGKESHPAKFRCNSLNHRGVAILILKK